MQALIDFEGWRRWRGFDNPVDADAATEQPGQDGRDGTLAPSPQNADGNEHVSPMHSSVVTPVPAGDGSGA